MRISQVVHSFNSEIKKIENTRKTEKEQKSSKVVADRSEISTSAKQLSDSPTNNVSIIKTANASPDVRTEKIQEVKSKIESGYYNSEEFMEKLADKLMKEFGLS